MPITIYGIKNCDTMKKARAFLDKKRVPYDFHDYKAKGIERGKLEGWAKKAGWEMLLSRAESGSGTETPPRALPQGEGNGAMSGNYNAPRRDDYTKELWLDVEFSLNMF